MTPDEERKGEAVTFKEKLKEPRGSEDAVEAMTTSTDKLRALAQSTLELSAEAVLTDVARISTAYEAHVMLLQVRRANVLARAVLALLPHTRHDPDCLIGVAVRGEVDPLDCSCGLVAAIDEIWKGMP